MHGLCFADCFALLHKPPLSGQHYPSDFFPRLEIDDMSRALEAISENRVEDIIIEEEGGEAVSSRHAWNARPEARDAITRMQFSWYQFDAVPREILGRAYPNLCHLDIRQNGEIICLLIYPRD